MSGNTGPLRVPARKPKVLINTSGAGTVNGTPWVDASGFKDWTFSLCSATVGGTITGWSVSIYGTLDPNVLNADGVTVNPNYPAPGAAGASWFLLPAESVETTGDTATFANPLTALSQVLRYKGPLLAVCAVSVGTAPTGTINVVGWAVD